MVYINEFIPNPKGSDTKNEWVELYNSGDSPINLSGWRIKNSSGKEAGLYGTISPGDYVVFKRTDTKLVLKNSGESLFLFSPDGSLVHQAKYIGLAPEGKSLSTGGTGFNFGAPTPGYKNKIETFSLIEYQHSIGVDISPQNDKLDVFGMMFGAGVLFACIILFIVKTHETISKQFR